jgi:tetratricopeptide (TPR) repeat protein
MVRAVSDLTQSATSGRRLKLRIGPNTYSLGREKALSLAHVLLKAKKYDLAARICEVVLGWDTDAPQPAILLACCKAGLQDYAACNRILQAVFTRDKERLVEHLQAALVYHNLGMTPDAVTELVAVADELPDLPMIWLLLGDEYVALGDRRKAGLCLRLAIDRDARGGPIALAARRQLTRLENG